MKLRIYTRGSTPIEYENGFSMLNPSGTMFTVRVDDELVALYNWSVVERVEVLP